MRPRVERPQNGPAHLTRRNLCASCPADARGARFAYSRWPRAPVPRHCSRSAPAAEPVAVDAPALFAQACAKCHGADGRGGLAMVANGPRPIDLTSSEWQRARSDQDVGNAIRTGRGAMPPFADVLTARQIDALGSSRPNAEAPVTASPRHADPRIPLMLRKILLVLAVLVLAVVGGVPAYLYGAYPKKRPAPEMNAPNTPEALERGRYSPRPWPAAWHVTRRSTSRGRGIFRSQDSSTPAAYGRRDRDFRERSSRRTSRPIRKQGSAAGPTARSPARSVKA